MKILIALLATGTCAGVVLAGSLQPEKDAAVVNAVKQVEQEMGDAMIRTDIDKLNQIYADDFAMIGSSGKIITKQDLLRDFASPKGKLELFENGSMDVQVFGNVAVVHGSVSEKRLEDGKEDSGQYVWMDLLEKRAGKWVVLRSAGTKIK